MIKRVLTFSDNIQVVHAGPEGLWIGHHGGLTHFDPGTGGAVKWTTLDGLPAHPVLHVTSEGERVAVATPNGVAWSNEACALARDARAERASRWERGLMHPQGAGAYVNGVAYVHGSLHAATGGGRIYRQGRAGFELFELPLNQARLMRMQVLPSGKKSLRLIVTTNNSGVLLLATGAGEEPSLYQWGEEEGLLSRYVTALAAAAGYIVVGVHGGVHVAAETSLSERPESVARWGHVAIGDLPGPAEHTRVPALCEHGGDLYIGTTAGLYRLPMTELEVAAAGRVEAARVDDEPVRHLASCRGDLWVVHSSSLGRFLEASAQVRAGEVEDDAPGSSLRRLFRGRLGGRAAEPAPVAPAVVAPWRRTRFATEARWRGLNGEPECRQVLALATSPDGLAVGSEAGRIVLHASGRWHTEFVARMRRPPEILTLAYDPDNATFWAATRFGLYQRDARGRWHRDPYFPGRTVHALVSWGGSVLALGSAGLHAFVQNEWRDIPFGGDVPALYVAAAREGALAMAGRPGAPLYVWRSGKPRPEAVEASVGRANCMAWGEDGELWLGSDRGLARWDGRELQTFSWDDEQRDHVNAVLVYDRRLYVGSRAGLWTGRTRDLQPRTGSALETQGQRFGLLEGLPDATVTALVVHNSAVWVGTQGGIALLG